MGQITQTQDVVDWISFDLLPVEKKKLLVMVLNQLITEEEE